MMVDVMAFYLVFEMADKLVVWMETVWVGLMDSKMVVSLVLKRAVVKVVGLVVVKVFG